MFGGSSLTIVWNLLIEMAKISSFPKFEPNFFVVQHSYGVWCVGFVCKEWLKFASAHVPSFWKQISIQTCAKPPNDESIRMYIFYITYMILCALYTVYVYTCVCTYIYIYTYTYVQIWTQTLVPNSDFFWSKINQSHHPTLPRKPEPSGNLGKSWTSPKNLGTIERSPSCFTHSKTQVFTTDHMVHWHLLRPHPIKLSPVQLCEFLRV